MDPEKYITILIRKEIVQPSLFRGELLNFRGVLSIRGSAWNIMKQENNSTTHGLSLSLSSRDAGMRRVNYYVKHLIQDRCQWRQRLLGDSQWGSLGFVDQSFLSLR